MWLPLKRPLLGTRPTTQGYALTGNRTSGSQASAQSIEPHQLGLFLTVLNSQTPTLAGGSVGWSVVPEVAGLIPGQGT